MLRIRLTDEERRLLDERRGSVSLSQYVRNCVFDILPSTQRPEHIEVLERQAEIPYRGQPAREPLWKDKKKKTLI